MASRCAWFVPLLLTLVVAAPNIECEGVHVVPSFLLTTRRTVWRGSFSSKDGDTTCQCVETRTDNRGVLLAACVLRVSECPPTRQLCWYKLHTGEGLQALRRQVGSMQEPRNLQLTRAPLAGKLRATRRMPSRR
jgi:hypothetical protein